MELGEVVKFFNDVLFGWNKHEKQREKMGGKKKRLLQILMANPERIPDFFLVDQVNGFYKLFSCEVKGKQILNLAMPCKIEI